MQLISSLEVGGAERLLIDFVKSCTEAPQIPQVVVVMNDHVDPEMASELNSIAIPTYYLGRPEGSRDPRYLANLKKIIRAHQVSFIHSHSRGSKYWSVLCRALRPDIKLVHTIHDTHIEMNSPEVLFHNLTIDATIAISTAVADEARSLGIKRLQQIDNGIPISLFLSIPTRPWVSPIRVISVGRISPEKKGQDILIRAVKRCVDHGFDIECTLVGSPAIGDFESLPLLEELASSIGIRDRIHFIQGRTDVAELLADANIFVLPSRWEGFGLALVEAMAAGLPVIASNVDGPGEIIADGIDGLLFKPGSDAQLAEKIAMLVQSPALADTLRRNGCAKSCQYDISRMRGEYMALYGWLAKAERAAS